MRIAIERPGVRRARRDRRLQFVNIVPLLLLAVASSYTVQAQQSLYLSPNTIVRFGLEGKTITTLRTDTRGGADRPAPLIAGTAQDGLYGIVPFDSSATWRACGFAGRFINAVNVRRWGAGPFEGFAVDASVVFGTDSTHEFTTYLSPTLSELPADTSWRQAENDTAKRSVRRVRSIASGNYGGNERPTPVLAGGQKGVLVLGMDSTTAPPTVRLDSLEITALAHDPSGYGGLFLAGGSLGNTTVIYSSTDEGGSWSSTNLPPAAGSTGVNALGIAFNIQHDTAYAGTRTGLWRSTDHGEHWSETTVFGVNVKALAIDPIQHRRIFAALEYNSGIVWSDDAGKTWKYVTDPLMGTVTSLALLYPASPDSLPYLFIGTTISGIWVYRVPKDTVPTAQKAVYYPLATGNTWYYQGLYPQWKVEGDTLLPDGKRYGILRENHYFTRRLERQQGDSVYTEGGLLYDFTRSAGDVLAFGGGVSMMSGSGDTVLFGRKLRWWSFARGHLSPFGPGSGEIVVDSIGIVDMTEGGDIWWNTSTLRGAIIDGIEYGNTDAVRESDAPADLPKEAALIGNYPNPFNPSTTIRYALPHRSHVTLAVFDILGQQVAVLVTGEIEAGYHDVRFDASGLAGGVYFYQLRAGSFVTAKKFLLMR